VRFEILRRGGGRGFVGRDGSARVFGARDRIDLALGTPRPQQVGAGEIIVWPRTVAEFGAGMVWAAALESLFYFYATGSLIAYMLQDLVATTDELFAAGATFTLLAWAFAYAYVVCDAVFPGSFAAAGSAAESRTWMELLYLSVAVLSSVGLSDIVPATPMARAIVMLESFAGVMYIALVVSRLITMGNASRQGGARD